MDFIAATKNSYAFKVNGTLVKISFSNNNRGAKDCINRVSYDDMKQGNTFSITGDGGNAWGYYGHAYKKIAPRLFTYTPYAEKYEELLKLKKDVLKLKDYIELKTEVYIPELKVDSNEIVKKIKPN